MSPFKRHLLIAVGIVIALTIAAITIIIINVGEISDPYLNERLIDKNSFEGEWPFTVEEGVIRCDIVGQDKALSFNALDGSTYALNDAAEAYSSKDTLGWQPTATSSIKSTDSNIDDVIKSGLTLCIE
ncbi:DUF2511 domain-containing protein [Psychrobacter sp. ANT_WB68]|uniref:DUF2511 domain-containing protein n=1 Tax=Psychrobacter sp. ANT_WB68 TaxID=2597355 RepID=UPI0011F18133|nr:DUF2511 domain-containing protein [Psychrobacter sp. ANT_WB68]KAA0913106.1 DUF2511 domain-containing protein [Psychrobacter sp. ANT_WB68]